MTLKVHFSKPRFSSAFFTVFSLCFHAKDEPEGQVGNVRPSELLVSLGVFRLTILFITFSYLNLLLQNCPPKATKLDRDDPILLEEGIEGHNKSRN